MRLDVHDNFIILIVAKVVHLCFCFTLGDGILRLQVTGVVHHGHSDFVRFTAFTTIVVAFSVTDSDVSGDVINPVH
jgi:hypothetical protein